MTIENLHRSDFPSNTKRAAQGADPDALATVGAAGPAAHRAVSVVETVELGASASRTWEAIRHFGTWQSWHPAFASTELTHGDGLSKGTVRVLTTQDGGQFTEELVEFNDNARSYGYRIIDSPAPVMDYVSTIKVQQTPSGSTVVWSSRFKVKAGTSEADAKKLIAGVYRAGLDNLATALD
jgi:hypothetical protein